VPLLQPLVCTKAHGLQYPNWCPAEPTEGNPTDAGAGSMSILSSDKTHMSDAGSAGGGGNAAGMKTGASSAGGGETGIKAGACSAGGGGTNPNIAPCPANGTSGAVVTRIGEGSELDGVGEGDGNDGSPSSMNARRFSNPGGNDEGLLTGNVRSFSS